MKIISICGLILPMIAIMSCVNVDTGGLVDRRAALKSGGGTLGIKNIFSYVSDCKDGVYDKSDFCECVSWAKDKTGSIPSPSLGESQNEYNDKAVPALLGYFDRIERCEQYAPFAIDFEIPANSIVANNVLKTNAGNIITPEHVGKIKEYSGPKGWTYKMAPPETEVDFSNGAFVFYSSSEEGALFKYSGSTSEYLYISGIKHFKNKRFNPAVIQASDHADECKFIVGDCVYGPINDRKKVVTKFEDGVWIRNIGSIGFKRSLQKTIYDVNGIPLYEYYQSPKYSYENIRYEHQVTLK